jgi:hypothetical protein
LLPSGETPDVYVIGFQEIVDLTTGNVLLSADITNSNAWTSKIKTTIDERTEKSYVLLKSRQVIVVCFFVVWYFEKLFVVSTLVGWCIVDGFCE